MMTETPTVRDLFPSTGFDSASAGEQLPPVPARLAGLVTGFEWKGIGERVLDLLDVSVADILLGGWRKHREVREQLRSTAADPSKTVLVNLASHTIKSTHAPSIQVRSRGQVLLELSCPIELTFELAAAELTVRGGDVRQIRTGDVKVRGTVKVEHTIVLQRELATVRLPGRILLNVDVPGALAAGDSAAAVM